MNIYETEHFNVAYQQAPELTIRDNVHVGVEVLYYPGFRGTPHFSALSSISNGALGNRTCTNLNEKPVLSVYP